MATIEALEKSGTLQLMRVKLDRKEFADRRIYVFPGFMSWLRGPVMTAKPFYKDDIAPRMQALELLKHFISGKPMLDSGLFKQMSPTTDDVWELRSRDIRFFGWFHRKDWFVAVSGDLYENLKADKSLYEVHRIAVRKERAALDLDEPKYLKGARTHDAVSE